MTKPADQKYLITSVTYRPDQKGIVLELQKNRELSKLFQNALDAYNEVQR